MGFTYPGPFLSSGGLTGAVSGHSRAVADLVSGKEIRDQLGERRGVNRPVERPTGRLMPTARHELVCHRLQNR